MKGVGKMNDKELLQKIKNVRAAVKEIYGNVNTITYPTYMVDWLIEQAEKKEYWERQHKILENRFQQAQEYIEQQEQKIKRLKEENKKHVSVVTDYAIEKMNLQQQLQQAQAKAERYEKALKEIANEQEVGEGDFNADDVANNLIATAKEALENNFL
jgi:predicted RNase H-like nuclease (RuvC/YqgF family)